MDNSKSFEEISIENEFGETEQYISVPYAQRIVPKIPNSRIQFKFEKDQVFIEYYPFPTGAYKKFNNISDFLKELDKEFFEQNQNISRKVVEIHNIFVREFMKMQDKVQNKHYEELAKINEIIESFQDYLSEVNTITANQLWYNSSLIESVNNLVKLVNGLKTQISKE